MLKKKSNVIDLIMLTIVLIKFQKLIYDTHNIFIKVSYNKCPSTLANHYIFIYLNKAGFPTKCTMTFIDNSFFPKHYALFH